MTDHVPADAPPVGSRVDSYRLIRVLGKGGMSTVYLAEEVDGDALVALKVLEPRLAADEEFRRRFVREARYAAELRHPNIVRVRAAGEADGLLYIAMDHVDGTDLHAMLAERGGLPAPLALDILAPIASALDAAHATGLVHRDVNPTNILVVAAPHPDDPPDAFLTDFGLGKKRSQDSAALTAAGAFVGTFSYTAPEQILDRQPDQRADIYSLGCVLFACLTGHPPFENLREAMVLHAHIEDPPPRVSVVRPEIPPAIDDVIARAMAKDPGDRFATCTEMIAAARVAITVGVPPGSTPAHALPGPPAPPAPTPASPPPASIAPLRLRVVAGSAEGQEIAVDCELLFGRHATGPGRLAQDGELSRRHARVSPDPAGGWVLEDLGSTNGTFVNDARLDMPRRLADGDVVEIGSTKLVVVSGASAPEATPSTEPTIALVRASLRLDVDFDARTARVEVGEGGDALRLVFEDGRWRQA